MAEDGPLVVGVDMATAEVRAIAADGDGQVQAQAAVPLPGPVAPEAGRSEQDASAWWPAVARVLREVADALGPWRGAVVAVSVAATSGTVVALDGAGDPIGPALMYGDQRAVDEARAAQDAGAERWARLGLRIQPSFGLPKWAWLLGREGVRASVARLAHAPDVVVGRLVGGAAPTDWSHALKSGYDPDREEWATEVLDALAVPAALLPDVRRPTEGVGRLSAQAADATSLPRSCEVKLGMTDSCAAQLAAGAGRPGRFVSVLGSTLVLKGASRELLVDPAGAVYSHRHPDGWWLPGGASSTGARALAERFGGRDLAELDRRAARHGPARAVAYPLVGRGERFPFAATDAEGFELDGGDDEDESYRAVLEGVAFVERLGFERLRALGAEIDPPVAAAGGGSGSEVWNRIRATVLGVPLVAAPAASTARGACILAAAGTVHPDLATAMDAMAATGDEVEGLDRERDALEANYERFVAALRERGWLPDGA
jgi:sugar (pentulose or hexulose) kinase